MDCKSQVNIAIQGCSHGSLDRIYREVEWLESKNNCKVDLLLCCGDFQSIRNHADLACMAVPDKYKKLGDFPKYYFEEAKVPVKTIFVGGNHEASNYLWELPYGGWVAPDIFYMGYANRVIYRGLHIGGVSGIHKSYNYQFNHFERPPFDAETTRSLYHSRHMDKFRLELLPSRTTDVFMSHDWPTNVYNYGDVNRLLRYKPFFRDEITRNALGDPNKYDLLKKLAPKYWYSAHLHCNFEAKVPIIPTEGGCQSMHTEFCALDKCRFRKCPLKLLTIDLDEHMVATDDNFYYDPQWLAIVRKTQPLFPCVDKKCKPSIPCGDSVDAYRPDENDLEEVKRLFGGDLQIPTNFKRNVAPGGGDVTEPIRLHDVYPLVNSQTVEFCAKLQIENPCTPKGPQQDTDATAAVNNPDEIDLS